MYCVYILQSIKTNKYYIGHTQDMGERLKRHNAGRVRSTKSGMPWKIVYIEHVRTKSEAHKREMQIKSYKGGNAFHSLLK